MTVILYGISNCDTVKKARRWLQDHGVEYQYHDLRKQGLDKRRLQAWIKKTGWEVLLNRRGTTWRKLDPSQQENITAAKALDIMLAHVSIIKRPVLEHGTHVAVGFSETQYETMFLK